MVAGGIGVLYLIGRMRWRGGPIAGVLAVVGIAAAPAAWWITDRLEEDNDFCNACHLSAELPLHIDLRRDFDAMPATSLSAAHAHSARHVETDREVRDFRCIDCHGGSGLAGRARVKLLAAKDAFWYAVGHFEEPTQMRWPLWDGDCTQCHASFVETEPEAWENPRFHQLAVHNTELGVDCVECHQVHDRQGAPDAYFLVAAEVRSQCFRCHPEFEEGS